jgi:hypothetical protein
MYDGRPYGGEYSVEDFDAESRYKGGEFGSRGGEFYSTTKTAAAATGEIARQAAADIAATEIAARDDLAEEGQSTTLRELLGGDFDLRRAIIETEILTPKYV